MTDPHQRRRWWTTGAQARSPQVVVPTTFGEIGAQPVQHAGVAAGGGVAGPASPRPKNEYARSTRTPKDGQAPASIHAKAAHLMRLLVPEHPFVDGNKRTALNTVTVYYDINGYDFDYEFLSQIKITG